MSTIIKFFKQVYFSGTSLIFCNNKEAEAGLHNTVFNSVSLQIWLFYKYEQINEYAIASTPSVSYKGITVPFNLHVANCEITKYFEFFMKCPIVQIYQLYHLQSI